MFRFRPGCCCDPASACRFFRDTFGRDDSDDPGPNYTETAGDWDIASSQLVTISPNALLLATTPGGSPNIRVQIVFQPPAVSAITRRVQIVLDYVDADNYWYAEIQFGTVAPQIGIFQRSGGTLTAKATTPIAHPTTTVTLCASIQSASLISVRVGSDVASSLGAFSSDEWGIATGSTMTGFALAIRTIDAYVVSADCPNCGRTCGHCSSGAGPSQLKVVVPAGTFEHFVTGGILGCEASECVNGEGTFYLQPLDYAAWQTAISYLQGGGRTNGYCAYGVCAPSAACAATGYAVFYTIIAFILPTGGGGTKITIALIHHNHQLGYVPFDTCGIYNTHGAHFTKSYDYSTPTDCSTWEDEQIDLEQRSWDTLLTQQCVPKSPSHLFVTAL